MQNELVFFISENDCNMRLDRWLVKKFNTTFIQIVKLIRQKKCKVNNMSTTINYKLNFGDKITIKKINLIEKDNQKSSINLNVLKKIQVVYKDENLLFINKPTNLAVQPGTGINSALSDMLAEFSFDMDNKPYLVHRIDKETSGLMVLARNRPTSVILGDIFKNNLIKKYYLAITHKSNIPLEGIINQPLYYDGISKSATTKYNVLAVNDHFMLIKCQILTGRKHQIRLHFSQNDFPIVNDSKYGIDKNNKQMLLHSYQMKFSCHNQKYDIKAIPNEYFIDFVNKEFSGIEY